MQDPHPPREAFLAHPDEILGRPLEPGGHHPAVGVPDGPEPRPVTGVAPDRPVLDQVTYGQPVRYRVAHRALPFRPRLACGSCRLAPSGVIVPGYDDLSSTGERGSGCAKGRR